MIILGKLVALALILLGAGVLVGVARNMLNGGAK